MRILVACGAAIGGSPPTATDEAARALAVRAVRALGLELAEVEVMRDAAGDPLVIEIDGAAEFARDYPLPAHDVFADAAIRLLDHARWPARTLAPV